MITVCGKPKETETYPIPREKQKPDDTDSNIRRGDDGKKQRYFSEEIRRLRAVSGDSALIIQRRARLKQLYERDAIELENLIRASGHAFIPTQP